MPLTCLATYFHASATAATPKDAKEAFTSNLTASVAWPAAVTRSGAARKAYNAAQPASKGRRLRRSVTDADLALMGRISVVAPLSSR